MFARQPSGLFIGIGLASGAGGQDLLECVKHLLTTHALAHDTVIAVASIDLRRDDTALAALAARYRSSLLFFDAQTLERETPRLVTPSVRVFEAVGCHGVAEAAALAAAGADGRLIVPKSVSNRITVAIAGT